MSAGETVITSFSACPSPPLTTLTVAAPVPSIVILNLCPDPEPALVPATSLYVPAVLVASAALIVSTVEICPVPVSSVAKLVAPDVCSYVQIHKPPPYLTTSFTLYLVVVA